MLKELTRSKPAPTPLELKFVDDMYAKADMLMAKQLRQIGTQKMSSSAILANTTEIDCDDE